MIRQLKAADYVTLLNLICGVLAIYFAFNNNLLLSANLIIASVVFDKLDGLVARLLKQESELGMQIDSLADLVSFGVAPAALIVCMFKISPLVFASILLPICGALRLARFNITKKSTPNYFIGVPITVNGIVFPILYFFNANEIIVISAVLIMSSLMISSIKIKKVLS